jgi:hypothetical protein
MNADEFYEGFKDALAYLGLAWGQKDLATVHIEGDRLVVSHGAYSATIQLPKPE